MEIKPYSIEEEKIKNTYLRYSREELIEEYQVITTHSDGLNSNLLSRLSAITQVMQIRDIQLPSISELEREKNTYAGRITTYAVIAILTLLVLISLYNLIGIITDF